MVLHYLEDGSITMKLNMGGKTFNEIFYSEIEYKKFRVQNKHRGKNHGTHQ